MTDNVDQQQETGITINDLFSAIQIIDAATRRGAFGAAEAASVGAVYERIRGFLTEAAPHLFEDPTQTEEVNNG